MLHTHSVLVKSPTKHTVCYLHQPATLLLGLFSYDIVLPKVECVFVCRYICMCVLVLHMHGRTCVSRTMTASCVAGWMNNSTLSRVWQWRPPSRMFANLWCGPVHFYNFVWHTVKRNKNNYNPYWHVASLALWQISQSTNSRLKLGLSDKKKWAFLSFTPEAFYLCSL